MRLLLVHHGDAVGPELDPRRPLSPWGRDAVQRLAVEAAARGVKPSAVWHSGKLRAKETAEAYWRACNPFAEFSATRDLQPDDPPEWIRDRLRGESRDLLIAGHYPHMPRLLNLLVAGPERPGPQSFPINGAVALRSDDDGETFSEEWRLDPRADPTRA
jgi:phosphohistidine phosphatase